MSFIEKPLVIETMLFQSHKSKPIISDDPDDYHSHFVQLTQKTSKGQARYRCVTCNHEFSCSGKRRKLQHILGRDFLLGKCKNRNVVPCPNPHEPLKKALLKLCAMEGNESLSRMNSGIPSTPKPSVSFSVPSSSHAPQQPQPPHFNQQLHEDNDNEFNSVIQEILSWGNEPHSDSSYDPKNQSFFSNASESSDEGEDNRHMPSPKRIRSGYNLLSPNCSFYSGVNGNTSVAGTSVGETSSSCSSRYSSPYTLPMTPARTPMAYNSQMSNNAPFVPMSFPEAPTLAPVPNFSFTSNPIPQPQQPPPQREEKNKFLNQAIFNFFSAYKIPMSALESPAFQEMVQHVQLDDTINKDMNTQVNQMHFY